MYIFRCGLETGIREPEVYELCSAAAEDVVMCAHKCSLAMVTSFWKPHSELHDSFASALCGDILAFFDLGGPLPLQPSAQVTSSFHTIQFVSTLIVTERKLKKKIQTQISGWETEQR